MTTKELDLTVLSNLASQHVDHATCIECCKFYIVPETSVCGHTLCHLCWRTRRTCPSCGLKVDRKQLKLNSPLQMLTEHVHTLSDLFEKLFQVKLSEIAPDAPLSASDKSHVKNVQAWLASSENHFSAPNTESQSTHESIVNVSTSRIQTHAENLKKGESPVKTVHVQQKQIDWDKIEPVQDSEDILTKNKENIIGPMDIEPFVFDDQEYTTNNLRRSLRKKDLKMNDSNYTTDASIEKLSSAKTSSHENEKKSNTSKQNWCNVKRMRKEFSKLNKKNKSKLNVSIEMCKKTNNSVLKSKPLTPTAVSQQVMNAIDDDTPDINKVNLPEVTKYNEEHNIINNIPKHKEVDVMKKNDETNHLLFSNKSVSKQDKSHTGSDKECIIHKNEAEHGNINNNLSKEKCLPFYKKSQLHTVSNERAEHIIEDNHINSMTTSTDDIEISIKIGNTLTNILIKKKTNDLKMKVNTDREIQTSLGPHVISCNGNSRNDVQNIEITIGDAINTQEISKAISCDTVHKAPSIIEKTVSTKKNTASAETATVNFEITESVEKELSKVMEVIEEEEMICDNVPSQNAQNKPNDPIDIDIFNSGSVKDQNVQLLKTTKNAPSEILPSFRPKTQKNNTKRDRDTQNEDITKEPAGKRLKVSSREIQKIPESENICSIQESKKDKGNDSENYDAIMGKVFANIDADIDIIQKSQNATDSRDNNENDNNLSSQILFNTQRSKNKNANKSVSNTQAQNNKYSENLFSVIDKDNETHQEDVLMEDIQGPGSNTQKDIDNLLTPGICRDLETQNNGKEADPEDIELLGEFGTPMQDHYDSDKSVVEETPQKTFSFSKPKQKNDQQANSKASNIETQSQAKSSRSQGAGSVINLSDTIADSCSKSKDATVIEAAKRKQTLETPLNMNKFFDQITHKSTPMARKSLNFVENKDVDEKDLEQTLCPSVTIAKTTQENEFMRKAFEDPVTPKTRLLSPTVNKPVNQNFCLVGSCLTGSELANVKLLCCERNWVYSDKYTTQMTHLIVGVDEGNRSQRSVKYMCALAASKWIVSYAWVEKCLLSKTLVDEEAYEALDATGDCGPRRSRMAPQKLFQGISFYCMPPFSVLDVDTLKSIVEAAGGRVVTEARQVRVSDDTPIALLLAEPENTQEDRFIYLAMEVSIVPVNYEWILNCLGSYSLTSIHDLLLCPATILPPAVKKWPAELIEQEFE